MDAKLNVFIPVSRKITFGNFEQEHDVIYSQHSSKQKVKFVIIDNHIYRVVYVNDPNVSSYSQHEYVLSNNSFGKVSKYEFMATTEFEKIPECKKVKIRSISNSNFGYFLKDDFFKLINENLEFSFNILVGRALFTKSATIHVCKKTNFEICVEQDEAFGNFPICEITENTVFEISKENFTSDNIVDDILEINETGVIDIKIQDQVSKLKSDLEKQEFSTIQESLKNELLKIIGIAGNALNAVNLSDDNYLLKSVLTNKIKEELFKKTIKIGDTLKFKFNKMQYIITVNSSNVGNGLKNYAFLIKTTNFHVNIEDKTETTTIIDGIKQLTKEDKIIFKIVKSNAFTVIRRELIEQILSQLYTQTFDFGTEFTFYVKTDKITVKIEDVFVKYLTELDSGNIIYNCSNSSIPEIVIENNQVLGIYAVDTEEKYKIESLSVKISKIHNSSTYVLTQTTVKEEKIKQIIRYKIQELCVFPGRTFNYEDLQYTIESVSFVGNVHLNINVIGVIEEFTIININKEECGQYLNITTDIKQNSRNLDINIIKNFAKSLEDAGLYGMVEHVTKFTKEVLLTRTTLVDDNLVDLVEPAKGVILHGPPGTGKTTLAQNVAKIFGSSGSRVKKINATEIKSKWHGESEGNIRKLFVDAIKEYEKYGDDAPLHILIIDEIDAILGKRTNTSDQIANSLVNQMLGEMDGINQFKNCITIGITNRLESLDEACLRPGRFGCHIFVDLPNQLQRKKIFESYHKKLERSGIIVPLSEVNYDIISSKTPGLSGADIKNVYQLCVGDHIDKKMNGINYRIEYNDVCNVLNNNYKVDIDINI